jgi:hypothetical protein
MSTEMSTGMSNGKDPTMFWLNGGCRLLTMGGRK